MQVDKGWCSTFSSCISQLYISSSVWFFGHLCWIVQFKINKSNQFKYFHDFRFLSKVTSQTYTWYIIRFICEHVHESVWSILLTAIFLGHYVISYRFMFVTNSASLWLLIYNKVIRTYVYRHASVNLVLVSLQKRCHQCSKDDLHNK